MDKVLTYHLTDETSEKDTFFNWMKLKNTFNSSTKERIKGLRTETKSPFVIGVRNVSQSC